MADLTFGTWLLTGSPYDGWPGLVAFLPLWPLAILLLLGIVLAGVTWVRLLGETNPGKVAQFTNIDEVR